MESVYFNGLMVETGAFYVQQKKGERYEDSRKHGIHDSIKELYAKRQQDKGRGQEKLP